MCHLHKIINCTKFAKHYSTRFSNELNKRKDADYIGPPDPVSNLRPIAFHQPENETELEKKYREAREATQLWNQKFWTNHNSNFIKERTQFREKLKCQDKQTVTADEMSIFYKAFLDKNWKTHFNYNILWYKKNVYLLLLEFRVRLSKLKIK